MKPNVRLTFRIGKTPILIIALNLQTKASHIEYVTNDEIVMHPILLPNERNYQGIQSRFQWWFNDKRELPDMLTDMKKYGFFFDGQSALRLEIQEFNWNQLHAKLLIIQSRKKEPQLINQHVKFISLEHGVGQRVGTIDEKINAFINGHPDIDIIKIDYQAVNKGHVANTHENTIQYSALIWYKLKHQ